MKLEYFPYTLSFRHPFTLSTGTRTSTSVVFTEISHEGHMGLGEASMPPYLGESHASVQDFLSKARPLIEKWKAPLDIPLLLKAVDELAPGNNAAKAAIDIALHDLAGKLLNKPCHSIMNIDPGKAPYTSYTIGIEEDRSVIRKKVMESGDFRILKAKLGKHDDKATIEAIRSVTDKPIIVDVNQGWADKHFALDMISWLSERNVLLVEQPVPKNNLDDAAWLRERSPVPVIADEAVQRLHDIEKIKGAYHGINIKLMKSTGLHEARLMIIRTRELGMKVLVGCMSETSCAVSAAAQLSPLADWADLDGPLLIKNDPFEGIQFDKGRVVLNDLPGIGVVKREGELKR